MSVHSMIFSFVILCAVVFGISFNEEQVCGKDCESSTDCQSNEICDKGFCQCGEGYVQYIHECIPVKIHGEECSYDIQCNNSKMVCANEELDLHQQKYCICDKSYVWNPAEQECFNISHISRISGNFREVYNVTGIIEKSAQKVFLGVVVAGLLFVSILLSFIGICSVYGCCGKHIKGRYGEDDLGKKHINEVAVIGLPGGTYEAIDTDFGDVGF